MLSQVTSCHFYLFRRRVDAKAIQDAITAAQVQATAVPLREYDADDVAAHLPQEPVVDIPTFEGFKDFELDLSCLSPPPSPLQSVLDLELRVPSPSASPSSPQSFSGYSIAASRSSIHSPRSLSPLPSPSIRTIRGSLPLKKYMGRGTPIDKNRRIEWGRPSTDEVGEDGFLVSEVRTTSLESARRPSQRSISPDWNLLTHSILARRPSTLPARSRSRSFASVKVLEIPTPEIQIEGLGEEKPEEWGSFVHTVLESAGETSAQGSNYAESSGAQLLQAPELKPSPLSNRKVTAPLMTPEEIGQLDTGIDMDLGINEALDLDLDVAGRMSWLNRGTRINESVSGRESPSIYSSPLPSPLPSRPPSVGGVERRSMASTKAERGDAAVESKSLGRQAWWRRVLMKLRRMQLSLGYH